MKQAILCILMLGCFASASAQTALAADKHLAYCLERIAYWHENNARDLSENGDSLEQANQRLEITLKDRCAHLPLDVALPFSEQAGLNIATAGDHLFRIYSWDTRLGGTMHVYNAIVAYRTPEARIVFKRIDVDSVSKAKDDRGYWYHTIKMYELPMHTTYVAVGKSMEGTQYIGEHVLAFGDGSSDVHTVNYFEAAGRKVNAISYSYDLLKLKGKAPSIHFSRDSKKLYIPIVERELFTGKYLVYKYSSFTFQKSVYHFVLEGEAKRKLSHK